MNASNAPVCVQLGLLFVVIVLLRAYDIIRVGHSAYLGMCSLLVRFYSSVAILR